MTRKATRSFSLRKSKPSWPSLNNPKIISAVIIVLMCFMIWYAWWGWLPPIIRGMPNNVDAARAALTATLRNKYPDGSSEELLVTELTKQGFSQPRACTGCDPKKRFMEINLPWIFPCSTKWYVSWVRGDSDHITSISGGHNPSCI